MACYKCGLCCNNLYLQNKIKISLATRTLIINKRCKFLDKDNLCKIYNKRPKICREFKCGALVNGKKKKEKIIKKRKNKN
jgi:Fe-S-cluster containining protein